jgi:prepilin-type processing-associated H-X9-DG protein
VPAVQKVRAAAATLQCTNNMKQLLLACHSYESSYKIFPTVNDPNVPNKGNSGGADSWLVAILPFIEQQVVQNHLNKDIKISIQLFLCPAEPRFGQVWSGGGFGGDYAMTDYVGVAGYDAQDSATKKLGIINYFQGTKIAWVTQGDGLSNTAMIAEHPFSTDNYWGWWAYPSQYDTIYGTVNNMTGTSLYSTDQNGNACAGPPLYFGGGPHDVYNPCSYNQLWSNHFNGANFAFGDGSVHYIPYSAALTVVALSTYAGNEAVSIPD